MSQCTTENEGALQRGEHLDHQTSGLTTGYAFKGEALGATFDPGVEDIRASFAQLLIRA